MSSRKVVGNSVVTAWKVFKKSSNRRLRSSWHEKFSRKVAGLFMKSSRKFRSSRHEKSSRKVAGDSAHHVYEIFPLPPPLHPSKVDSWKPNTDCCFWDGVTCDIATGDVIGLDLSDGSLYGFIDSNSSLFHLRRLRTLNLAFNFFNFSQIPSGFHRLTSLTHLNLSNCYFSGQIPFEISGMTQLVSLDLSNWGPYLKLEKPSLGTLVQRLTNLQVLHLDHVNISSVVPDFLANLSSLTSLHLKSCNLYGEFQKRIFLLPNLQSLDLGFNPGLIGKLPEFHSNSSLRYLGLSFTSFSGELTNSIGNLKLLNHLDLSGCNLSGSFPSSIFNLTNLNYLGLYSNHLTGPIPSCLSYFSNLTFLDLGYNSLSGEIPSSLFTLASLQVLYLDQNKLHGPIPNSISKLRNLETLFLSSNNLSGIVELNTFLKLKNLTYLDLGSNGLSLITTVHTDSDFPKFQYLYLSSCNISEFPDFLRNQTELSQLDLSNNKIHGKIPKWIWNVGNKTLSYLNLSHNFLQGFDQPSTISPWPKLSTLDLHSNQLQGPLPSLLVSTDFFSIANNKLTGEIPPSICNASYLYVLDFSNNSLSGVIPHCLGNFSNSISVLNLRSNYFHGTIPQMFIKGSSLTTLDLNGNQLEGRVPRSLVHCKMLEVLNLGNNQLNDTFPFWLETLPELQVLDLRSNKFHGPIGHPRTDQAFSKLRIIDLSYNKFVGNLPSTYFLRWNSIMMIDKKKSQLKYMNDNSSYYYHDSVMVMNKGQEMFLVKILTIFTAIDFSNNRFQGKIPDSIGNLKSLLVLNLSSNCLTGHIPSSLENLKELESLDLSQNKLSGEIPQQLTSLTFLEVMNLSRNHLTGRIPQGQQFETFSNTSFDGNAGLCGSPLSKKCRDADGVKPPPSAFQQGKDLEATSEGFDWKIVLMGYGCGVVIGVVIGYITSWRQNGWLDTTLSKWNVKRSKKRGDTRRRR
ncbi:hypothetical protein HHK36_033397 [Tetracentron sinense]|uniref:Leucine-rich repeat-containing N-terminal plant-type domain-containing protein n=1 Tax=Tetracentron sinense TaxID=13715 RepID=A0A834Y6J5_TETSI|nr:hypothetical protein HHK36_033397 [Tetracentron sinense]